MSNFVADFHNVILNSDEFENLPHSPHFGYPTSITMAISDWKKNYFYS